MKTSDKSNTNKCRYKIQGHHIVDTNKEIRNGDPIYISEILDSSSSEFRSSSISAKDRLDIVGSLGLGLLAPVMGECLESKGYCASKAPHTVIYSLMYLLNDAYQELGFCLVENDSRSKLILQLLSLSGKYKNTVLPHGYQTDA